MYLQSPHFPGKKGRFDTGIIEEINRASLSGKKVRKTQNSPVACPRKIFQQAVIALKLIHAAIEGQRSGDLTL